MGKTEIWIQKQRKIFSLIRKCWLPILKESFLLSIFWWITALGLVFLATVVSLIKTYQEVGRVDMNNFFPPNFGWGVLVVLIGVFIWWIIVETSSRMEELRIKADKFTWNDVSIKIPKFPENNPVAMCLQVVNNKVWKIENAIVEIENIKKDRFLLNHKTPAYLGWVVENPEEFLQTNYFG